VRRPGLVVFVVALGLRLAWVLRLPDQLRWIDETQFVGIARSLAAGHGFVSDSYRANPLLPAYLGLVFRAFGESLLAARIGQAVIGALTCVVLLRIGTRLAGPALGLLAGLMLALYPPHVYLAGVFYVDCVLGLPLALGVLLALDVHQGRGGVGRAVLAGGLLGLAALARPTFLVVVPALALAWCLGAAAGVRRRLELTAALGLGALAVVLPWTARNEAAYGRLVPISSGLWTKLWQGNGPLADGSADDRDLLWGRDLWTRRLARLDPERRRAVEEQYAGVARAVGERLARTGDFYLATDEVLRPVVLDLVRRDPGRVLVLAARKTATLYSAFSRTETQNQDTTAAMRLVAAVSFYPLLGLAAVGAFCGRAGGRRWLPISAVVVSVTATYALLTACTRFRLPLDPYLMLFASRALVRT